MNINLLMNYFPILIFLIIAFIVSSVMIFLPFLMSKFQVIKGDKIKLSAYECGFEAFENARVPFDIRFYLVSILFIIFDLEIAFLFPWAIILKQLPLTGFFSMMFFLFILTIGFIYEWKKGALDWK